MTEGDHRSEVRFVDRGDWPQAVICLVFLMIFPIAIIAMLQESREIAPLKYIIPFAGLFVLGAPFLFRQVSQARTRELVVESRTGTITLSTARPLQRLAEKISPDLVERLIFETTEDDGYWYSAIIELRSSRRIAFSQGSYEPAVKAQLARMAEALGQARPDLQSIEMRGRSA